MASLTLKNTALILGSMLIGGALTAALYARLTPVDAAAPAAPASSPPAPLLLSRSPGLK
ncbi:efflux RND transporter periplasmic adaptor subunit, partial [Klebsiella pneumoniae]